MTAKVILAGFSLGLALLFGIQQLRSDQEIKERMRRGRIPVAVEDAKAKNQREVSLPASIPYYASVKDLDDALANYTTVIAEPVLRHSQMNAESKEIETWYKLELLSSYPNLRMGNVQIVHLPKMYLSNFSRSRLMRSLWLEILVV